MGPTEEPAARPPEHESTALAWAALLAGAALVWLVAPVGVGLLVGAFLAFMMQSALRRLEPRIGRLGSSLLLVGLTMVALTGVLFGLGWLLVTQGTVLAGQLIEAFKPGGQGSEALGSVARLTERFNLPRSELEGYARELATSTASRATEAAKGIAAATGAALLGLFFAALSMQYMLRNWEQFERQAERTLPLRPAYTASLFAELRRVGRSTLVGAVGTATVQGILATIGYAIAGVPEPAFFGVVTALASFIPAIGTLLVIVPVTTWLFVSHHPGHAVFEIIWAALMVVGACDYLVRPRLVSDSDVPTVVTFAALFGGVEVFGLKGLILGPVLMALSLAILRLYALEAADRRLRQ